MSAERERVAYIDWLRVVAFGGVFLVHVCEPFNPWDTWHITNTPRSPFLGELIVLFAPWIMPLFMLLAGAVAWHSLEHRSNAQYVKERILRIFVPLMIGLLVLVPPQVYAERVWRGQYTGSFFAWYPQFFHGWYPKGNFSWHHLWFIAHLFIYSIIAVPLFRHWRTERGQAQLRRVARWCRGPGGLLWLAVPLIAERHAAWMWLSKHQLFNGDWSNQSMLFVAYLYGFALTAEPAFGKQLDREWPRALVYGLGTTAGMVWLTWIGQVPDHWPPRSGWGSLAFWTLYAFGAWASMIAVLGIGRRFLRKDAPFLARARRDGYAWYLLHQTIIVLIAARVVPWQAPVAVKVLVIALPSIVLTVIGSDLLVRVQRFVGRGFRPAARGAVTS